MTTGLDQVLARVLATPASGMRRLVAIAGPPASGKSTLAEQLCTRLNAAGEVSVVVPMDGFHLDNRILDARGTRARKGAPHTFDALGFVHLSGRLKSEDAVCFPVFDRAGDCAISGAGEVTKDVSTVLIEGNYLLLQAPVWEGLAELWDFSLFLAVDESELERRLLERWRAFGNSTDAARHRAEGNDLPNARLVMAQSRTADIILKPEDL